ncbi:cyclase family protein [Nocardiopsis sp. HNM0947]|uniref:Cyclase family protein n=1 Tax=Nocardiopsis coralli TaxID=2772213 RepID=A0ABR9P729_9ACTN|nr:cyclase family protein [Nocardiopsis coralli]MBE2999651.1 cyclase family protein [Nocardiopsis coralli]
MCLNGTGETVRARTGDAAPDRTGGPAPGASAWPSRPGRVVDLSHVLSPSMATFDEEKPVRETVDPPLPEGESGFHLNRWSFLEHTGTHLDAPGHVVGGGRLVPDIAPEELVVPAVVVDVRERASRDPDTVLTVEDVLDHERVHGPVPEGAAVLMLSGWDARWERGDPAVRGVAEDGSWHFPGLSAEACAFLLERRGAAGFGVDTLSTDPGVSTEFPAHEVIGRGDRWGLECLTGLERLPARGATLVVGVMPGEDASGAPSRVLALV